MLIEQLFKKEILILSDMDGVLCDFKKGIQKIYPEFTDSDDKKQDKEMWKRISRYQHNGGEFWLDLDPMPDFDELMEEIRKYPYAILSAAGDPKFNAEAQKRKWVPKYIRDNIKVNIVRRSVDKAQYAQPHIVLIDDKEKSINPFVQNGGIGILHKSAKDTIQQLKKLRI